MLWSPILRRDNKSTAGAAATYLADSRVEHFWDLWSFAVKLFTQQFQYPEGETAWDIFIVYRPNLRWEVDPPEPTVLLQHRDLEIGFKYSQDRLQQELLRWAQEQSGG